MTKTKDNFFRPEKLSSQAKAAQTSSVAKDILASEVSARQKKTERLRALRLASTAADPSPQPTATARKRK